MDSYGWKVKMWKFDLSNMKEKRKEMEEWVNKWKHKYRIEEIYVNNAYAVYYKLLFKA